MKLKLFFYYYYIANYNCSVNNFVNLNYSIYPAFLCKIVGDGYYFLFILSAKLTSNEKFVEDNSEKAEISYLIGRN